MRDKFFKQLFSMSLKMGFSMLIKKKYSREIIKRILCPMDPSRYYELPALVDKFSQIKKKNKVLDISSPKLITYYLAANYKTSKFEATDIQRKEIESWKNSFGEKENLKLKVLDARRMSYADNSFDVVYSVSTVEHILDNKSGTYGDLEFVKEAYRILKKGGVLILTTMISKTGSTLYKGNNIYGLNGKSHDRSKFFFARVYSKKDLFERLMGDTKFKLIYFEFCKYKSSWYENTFNKLVPFSVLFGFLNILFMPNLTKIYKSINRSFGDRSDCLMVLKK